MNALQSAISKYTAYFGADSLAKSREFLTFCVDVEKALAAFDSSAVKKDKNAAKAVAQIRQKLSKGLLAEHRATIADFKSGALVLSEKATKDKLLSHRIPL